jgi:hypothetical protein
MTSAVISMLLRKGPHQVESHCAKSVEKPVKFISAEDSGAIDNVENCAGAMDCHADIKRFRSNPNETSWTIVGSIASC